MKVSRLLQLQMALLVLDDSLVHFRQFNNLWSISEKFDYDTGIIIFCAKISSVVNYDVGEVIYDTGILTLQL